MSRASGVDHTWLMLAFPRGDMLASLVQPTFATNGNTHTDIYIYIYIYIYAYIICMHYYVAKLESNCLNRYLKDWECQWVIQKFFAHFAISRCVIPWRAKIHPTALKTPTKPFGLHLRATSRAALSDATSSPKGPWPDRCV